MAPVESLVLFDMHGRTAPRHCSKERQNPMPARFSAESLRILEQSPIQRDSSAIRQSNLPESEATFFQPRQSPQPREPLGTAVPKPLRTPCLGALF